MTWRAPPRPSTPAPPARWPDVVLLPWEPPLTPDPDTARQWLQDELDKDIYTSGGTSWLDDLFGWINRLIDRILNGIDAGTGQAGLLGIPGSVMGIIVVALAIGVVLFLLLGPLRPSRRRKKSAAVFEDDERTAQTMLSAADAAAKAGDWDTAVVERFRAIVRSIEEAGWVPVVPGMTAYEFAMAAGAAAPQLVAEFGWAADLFDGVRYGHASGSEAADLRLRALHEASAKVKATVHL